jgi:hypothetical protein
MAKPRYTRTIWLVAAVAAGAVLILLLAGSAPVAHAVDRKNCSDFNTQKQAQRWFNHHHPAATPRTLIATTT